MSPFLIVKHDESTVTVQWQGKPPQTFPRSGCVHAESRISRPVKFAGIEPVTLCDDCRNKALGK